MAALSCSVPLWLAGLDVRYPMFKLGIGVHERTALFCHAERVDVVREAVVQLSVV